MSRTMRDDAIQHDRSVNMAREFYLSPIEAVVSGRQHVTEPVIRIVAMGCQSCGSTNLCFCHGRPML